ncbi:MAG TPA: FAD:protein FMN transferase [Rhodothermales bacterium]
MFNRRTFLGNCAKTLGGLAVVGASPQSIFAFLRPRPALYDESIWSMGTQVRLSIRRDEYRPQILQAAFDAVRQVDRELSVHRSNSELSRLNDSPGTWRPATRLLSEVSRSALALGDLSEGALDVTVLPVLRRLGFAPGGRSPAAPEVVDFTKLKVNGKNVMLESGGYAVDFGGIAKGFAVDEALRMLREDGIDAALLDAGGDLFAMGRPETGKRWRIGIRDPFEPDTLFAVVDVEDEAVATSGTYAQTRTVDGVEVSHIIDPRSCRSVNHVVSATVLARDTMRADALATAISVMEPRTSFDLIESQPETEALWVFADGRTTMTSGLKRRVSLV